MGGVMGCERNDTTVAICTTIFLYQLRMCDALHAYCTVFYITLIIAINYLHCSQLSSQLGGHGRVCAVMLVLTARHTFRGESLLLLGPLQ